MTIEYIKELEEKYNIKILYVTIYGSRLFGTETEESDIDYRGIYVSTVRDMILKKDLPYIKLSTSEEHTKNSKDDVDFELDSIQTFINELSRTGPTALDVLFSVFHKETTIYINPDFENYVNHKYKRFLWQNKQTMLGYCQKHINKLLIRDEQKIKWKEISHVVRTAAEFKELLETSMITFPLKEADIILKIKQRNVTKSAVISILTTLKPEIEALLKDGPTEINEVLDVDFMENFVYLVSMGFLFKPRMSNLFKDSVQETLESDYLNK